MADHVDEFTLESVRDFMISRGGRVTNHELVKQFKVYLTNPSCKEIARNKFKQYVNTLANISQEGGEKYLVLKRKFRVGTPLSESEYLSPNSSPLAPRFASPGSQYNIYGTPPHPAGAFSPQAFSPSTPPPLPPSYRTTPPYRAPPPYRPPPAAPPTLPGYSEDVPYGGDERRRPPPPHFNGRHQGGGDPRYPGEPVAYPGPEEQRYPPVGETRYNEIPRYPYDEPADLGIPPAPQVARTHSSLSSYSSSSGSQLAPAAPYANYSSPPPPLTPLAPSRPKSLPVQPMSSVASPSEDGSASGGDDVTSGATTLSAATTASSASTPSSDEPPPPVPPRKRPGDNKENQRPSPEGEEARGKVVGGTNGEGSADAVDNGSGGGGGGGGTAEDERKVSVREATQRFNRMASESQLISSRASSKSNRSSRSDRDDDDSSSIHSYGPEGQEWILAAAKSDFNEILRLLKIHPTLAKYKDIANGYTALHWAAKQGRVEVVKLLAGTHHVDVNARSNGGYTPLHIAAMYNRTEVFDLLVHYGADLNMRDYSGKKPRTYNTIASTVSHDTQKSKYSPEEDGAEESDLERLFQQHEQDVHGSHEKLYWTPSTGFERAKRVGSKRLHKIKRNFSFNAHHSRTHRSRRRKNNVDDDIFEETEA
ncbi:ankyrin repeat domain-containing protein SOWAHA [Penaeus vannamei]|uniref:ankyrin repeat domain-containing protein SOWAHA n=1 Tax=Penaeus vannamei TaxID=6689 RepID=UPI00387F6CD8